MPKNAITVDGKRRINLEKCDPASTAHFKKKSHAEKTLQSCARQIGLLQDVLFARKMHMVLVILHGTDTSGKSSVINYVFREIHPAGCAVTSFKAPSAEELDHDYLWRCIKELPRRGHIGVFDRSYYEELSVVRVHPEFLTKQRIPEDVRPKNIWRTRAKEIMNFERYLYRNGVVVIKFFLNLSREEQGKRFRKRMVNRSKNAKFAAADLSESKRWEDYRRANQDLINRTATAHAPWYILPADHKWVTRALAAEIVAERLQSLGLRYPTMSAKERRENLALIEEMYPQRKK